MKLNQTLVKVIDAATPDALTIAVNAWLKTAGEATLLATHFCCATDLQQTDSTQFAIYSVMIVYTN